MEQMPSPVLRTAIGNYGHTAALKDGTITSPMFDLEHVEVSPVPMIFRRMVRGLEFDVAEMALATCFCARAHGKRFTGIPIFLTRAFYHGELLCHRRSGIRAPKDLEGRKVGVRSYTFTPGVWTRGILAAEYDVDLDAVTWVLSGDEHVQEYVAPANVVSSPNNNLATMLLAGEIDAAIAPGPVDSPDIQPLFPDARQADDAWRRRTGIYPISHLLVVKDAALASHPGLATELFRLFSEARSQYLPRLRSGAADDAGDRSLRKMPQTVGGDPLPYGFESSRRTLETFIRYNVEQGVIPRAVAPEDLFVPETLALV